MKASVVPLLSRIRDGALSLSHRIVNFVPTAGRVALLLLLAIMVYRALSDRAILIEPFGVPREVEAKGYTGRILASALIDAVHDFRRSVQSSAQQSEFRSTWNAMEVDFDVEAAGFSSKKLTQIFRYVLGVAPTRLSGEVVDSSEGIRLTVRASNKSHSIEGQLDKLDSMIKAMAPHVVRVSEPYFLGLAVVDTDPKLTLDIVQEVLKANDSRWYPWGYNLWGIVLDKQAKHEEAQEKFKQALSFDRRQDRDARVAALTNLGVSVKQAGDLSAAEVHFRDAIQLKQDYAGAHLNLANLLKEKANYKEAVQHYREAIEAAPSQAELYYRRAEALSQQKHFVDSISDLEFALKLNPTYADALFDLGLNACLLKECERASKYFDEYLAKAPSGKFAAKTKYLRLNCPEECLRLRK